MLRQQRQRLLALARRLEHRATEHLHRSIVPRRRCKLLNLLYRCRCVASYIVRQRFYRL